MDQLAPNTAMLLTLSALCRESRGETYDACLTTWKIAHSNSSAKEYHTYVAVEQLMFDVERFARFATRKGK